MSDRMDARQEVASRWRLIREIVKYFLRLGTLGFGGPVALVGLMERDLVGEKRWLIPGLPGGRPFTRQKRPPPFALGIGLNAPKATYPVM